MPSWILTDKGTLISTTKVQRITILEKETYKIKDSFNEFDTEISRCFIEKEYRTYDGSKPNTEDWSKYL